MSHVDQEPTGARKQPEQTVTTQEENTELMSFENQPQKGSGQESELLKNAMNPLESRNAKPTNTSDERTITADDANPARIPTPPPTQDGFINIDAED